MIIEILAVSASALVGTKLFGRTMVSRTNNPRRRVVTVVIDRTSPRHGPSPYDVPDHERETCKNFALTSSAGIVAAGAVYGSVILSAAALVLMGIVLLPLIKKGIRVAIEKRRLEFYLLAALSSTFSLAAGYLFITALADVFYFGGEVLLMSTRRKSREVHMRHLQRGTEKIWVKRDDSGTEVSVSVTDVNVGDVYVVGAGEVIGLDGTVVAGSGGVDESSITGESMSSDKSPGDSVFASTIVNTGRLEVRTDQDGRNTLSHRIQTVMNETDSYEESLDNRCTTFANRSVGPSVLAGIVGLTIGGPMRGVTAVCSNFADANLLTSPLSILSYIVEAGKLGILVKDGRSLEQLGDIDTIVFDKTGTLTTNCPEIISIEPATGVDEDALLGFAAGAENRQTHPVAQTLLKAASDRRLDLPLGRVKSNHRGNGVISYVGDHLVHVGSVTFFALEGIEVPPAAQAVSESALESGESVVLVARDHQWIGLIRLGAAVRPEVVQLIPWLKAQGLKTVIISGDHQGPTRRLAEILEIDEWHAGVLPFEKSKLIARMQQNGRSVCFVGDGVNDGIALKTATVSISLGKASAVAIDSAQILLLEDSLRKLQSLMKLAKQFRTDQKRMRDGVVGATCFSTFGALFLHFTIPMVLLVFISTVASGCLVAAAPRWRRSQRCRPYRLGASPAVKRRPKATVHLSRRLKGKRS